jgi:hypothetical protein
MALRDWIVKNTVGVAGYGDTLGREVVTNGFARWGELSTWATEPVQRPAMLLSLKTVIT